ncbi:MAG: IS21 family transposase [Actinomycetota bacterium]
MFSVHDWAEVHRLFHREQLSKAAIARRLGMDRHTVSRLLGRSAPPQYVRAAKGSMLDPHREEIAAMLDADPEVPATVILEHLRPVGYAGGITILKDHLANVRPQFLAARSFQRTSYLPGEIGHADWWETGRWIPVGKGATRELYGLVATLPHSAAHAAVFTLSKTLADVRPAFVGCFTRLGGVPEAVVVDNDSSIVHSGKGRTARLHDEVAALFGQLGAKVIVLEPGRPESKGQVERTNGFLDRSFLPLREFTSLQDVQDQHDDWAANVAFRRHHRRIGARVAEAWAVEKGFLRALPDPLPDTDARLEVRVSKDGFVRVSSADYSVPPGLSGRRVHVRMSPERVVVSYDGTELARHHRSFVPADVVIDARHARALRQAREARANLRRGDVELPEIDLRRYDALVGADLGGPGADPAPPNGSEALPAAGFSGGARR